MDKNRKLNLTSPSETAAPPSDNEISGHLVLTVLSAENLQACDASGTSDPYCVVKVLERGNKSGVVVDLNKTRNSKLSAYNPWAMANSPL